MKKMMATVFVAALALLANQSALARNPYKDYVKESERVLTSPAFQAELARVLQPEDHQKFKNNLGAYISGTEFGSQSPFYGSALYGSLAYYEEGAPFSGVVIAPNGYYYIVYKSK
ncbi:MAG: hypothetical protein Q4B71_05815 [Cardiobacteriaceae bacterium]|nr:hypothetical protein [Cardiobacteriaceae bacterium]